MYQNNSFAEGYAIGRDSANNHNGCGCGYGYGMYDGMNNPWWLFAILAFGYGGFGGFGGFGRGYGAAEGALTRGELCQDMNFNNLESGVRGISQGLCDGFYAMNTGIGNIEKTVLQTGSGLQNSVNQGFSGVYQAIISQGYESRIATNELGRQVSSCCCDLQGDIKDNKVQGIMNTNTLQQQISSCCCDNEKMQLQGRYEAAREHCETLKAIGDLKNDLFGYMNAQEMQRLRDENQYLRLDKNQCAQNAYLIDSIRPTPRPTFNVPSPYFWQGNGYNNYGGYYNDPCRNCA